MFRLCLIETRIVIDHDKNNKRNDHEIETELVVA